MKNRKQRVEQAVQPRTRSFAAPEIVSMDALAIMTDDELYGRFKALDEQRRFVYDNRFDSKLWEIELAYVKREVQIRMQRKNAFAAYEEEVRREFDEMNDKLPVADLDNSEFLRLVGELN